MLRNFLYLDSGMVNDYLAQILGALPGDSASQREKTSGEKGLDVGGQAGPLRGGLGKSNATEEEWSRTWVFSDPARFDQLCRTLEDTDRMQTLAGFDTEIWQQIDRGEIIEFDARICLLALFEFIEQVDQVAPVLEFFKSVTDAGTVDPLENLAEISAGINAFSGLGAMMRNRPITVTMRPEVPDNLEMTANLKRESLRVPVMDLRTTATVLAKVSRKLEIDEEHVAFDLTPVMGQSATLNRRERRAQNASKTVVQKPNDVREVIHGPGGVLQVVAIYT